MTENEHTFWMVPRAILSADADRLQYQRALLAYHVLFSGKVIISDSDVVNNLFLRNAIRADDDFVLELLAHKLLTIARRTIGGEHLPLGKVSEAIARRPGGLLGRIAPGNSPELARFEYLATSVPYDLNTAQPRYQVEVLRVFKATRFDAHLLPQDLAIVISQICEETISSGGTLSWNLFTPQSELWPAIQRRLGDDTALKRFGDAVFEIARGPYSTYLPSALGVGASYSSEDRVGVDIWRGRYNVPQIELDRQTLTAPAHDLADMIGGLMRLTVTDLVKLRASAARAAYEDACANYLTSNDFSAVLRSFFSYRAEINDAISGAIRRSGKLNMETVTFTASLTDPSKGIDTVAATRFEKFSFAAFENYQACLAFACSTAQSALLSSLTLGTFGYLQFAYSRIQSIRGSKEPTAIDGTTTEQREREVEQKMQIIALGREDPSVIQAAQYLDSSTRDLFSTVISRT
jgi:hypothetical protein